MMKEIIKPAICCIGYNRPKSMRRLLNSISNAVYDDDDITLIISIDHSDKSSEVVEVANSFQWVHGIKRVIHHPHRLGLRDHCIMCGDFSLEFGAVIFLEDDVVVSPGFYRYVKQASSYYNNSSNIIGVSLYSEKWVYDLSIDLIPAHNGYDVFFSQRELSHGQCWLKNGWIRFKDWYSKHNNIENLYNNKIPPCVYQWNPLTSWSRFMSFFMVEKDMFYACPYHSYATNLSEVGIHAARTSDICQIPLTESTQSNFLFPKLNEGVCYDAFYERISNAPIVSNGVKYDNICYDLNGKKYDWSGYKYILTTKTLPYKLIKTYGLNMEPIENNVLYSVPGDGIMLYEIPLNYSPLFTYNSILKVDFSKKRIEHLFNKVPFHFIKYIFSLKIKDLFFH